MESSADDFITICLNLTSEDALKIGCNEYEHLEKVVSRVVLILFTIIGILGFSANALVVVVVVTNHSMRSTTDLFIINSATADLLFIIFGTFATVIDYVMPGWPFGDSWCKFVQYFIVVTAHVSVYNLVFISLDRYMAILKPIASISIRTERNAKLAIACIWVVFLITAIPIAICYGEREYSYFDRNHSSCVFFEEHCFSKLGLQITFFLSLCEIPLALIFVLNTYMLRRLSRSPPGRRLSDESRRRRKKNKMMLVAVVVVFAVCSCPNRIILLLKALDMYNITYFTVIAQIVSHALAYMNSCVNPVLYAFLSENFRVALRRHRRPPQPTTITPTDNEISARRRARFSFNQTTVL